MRAMDKDDSKNFISLQKPECDLLGEIYDVYLINDIFTNPLPKKLYFE